LLCQHEVLLPLALTINIFLTYGNFKGLQIGELVHFELEKVFVEGLLTLRAAREALRIGILVVLQRVNIDASLDSRDMIDRAVLGALRALNFPKVTRDTILGISIVGGIQLTIGLPRDIWY